jgi:hypothetical protein
MADQIENPGAVETPVAPSDSVELTAEQRDEATIARLLGGNDEKTPVAPVVPADADAAAGEDEGTSDAAAEADGQGEGDADDDELPEVTDEELEAILDALDDRILANPRIQKVIDERTQADSDRRYEERRKAESVSQESERLIRQGRTAVENVYDLFGKLTGNLDKAVKGEDIDETVKFDRDALMGELGAFGAAAVAEARRDTDTAFADAFREGAVLGGVLTDADKTAVIGIVEKAKRIANDPEQGRAASVAFLFKENVKFLVDRAKKAGAAEAEAAFQKKRDGLKAVVGENGTKAAIAKIANARKKLPAKPTTTPAEATAPSANMEAYKAAKAAGEFQKADEIAAAMSAAT